MAEPVLISGPPDDTDYPAPPVVLRFSDLCAEIALDLHSEGERVPDWTQPLPGGLGEW